MTHGALIVKAEAVSRSRARIARSFFLLVPFFGNIPPTQSQTLKSTLSFRRTKHLPGRSLDLRNH